MLQLAFLLLTNTIVFVVTALIRTWTSSP
jgi:hypothetical protein